MMLHNTIMRPATVRGSGVRRDDAAAIVKLVCHCLDSITEDSRKPRPIPCDALASCANAPSLSPRQRRSSEIGADTWEGALERIGSNLASEVEDVEGIAETVNGNSTAVKNSAQAAMAFCAALSVILPRSTESFGCNPQAQREAVVWLQFPMKNALQ